MTYLPPKKLYFKGLKIKNSIEIVGNNQSCVMMQDCGFKFVENHGDKIVKMSELNLRSNNLKVLFDFEEEDFDLCIQNSVLQSISSPQNMESSFSSFNVPNSKRANIIVKNSIIQNFDNFITIGEKTQVKYLGLTFVDSRIGNMKTLLSCASKIEQLKIVFRRCTLEFLEDFLKINGSLIASSFFDFQQNEVKSFGNFLTL